MMLANIKGFLVGRCISNVFVIGLTKLFKIGKILRSLLGISEYCVLNDPF